MQLSELVQFLNYLDQYDLNACCVQSLDPVNSVAKMIANSDTIATDQKQAINNSINHVQQSLTNFSNSVGDLRRSIMQQIVQQEQQYLANSTELFNTGMRDDSVEHIVRRTVSLSEAAAANFEQRLKIHTSWQYPGLIFRPVHLTALQEIVALDPMYLVDTKQELLTQATAQFTDRYQQRVRNYVFDDYDSAVWFDQLPQAQFGLVVAQNFFNFKPLEVVNRVITEVYDLLRPGGAFVFTYNNCDYAGPVKLAERSFACYTPGRLIKQTAHNLGYEIAYEHNEINGVGILELTRPGKKHSLRGGQTLAVIKDHGETQADPEPVAIKKQKPPKAVDTAVTKYYTDSERTRLQLSAVVLDIDTETNVINNYTIEKIDQLVTERLNTPEFNHDKFQKRLNKLIEKRKNT
jgi:SAM-dependent methyltransferase